MVIIPQMLSEMVFSSEAVGSSPFFAMSTRKFLDDRPVILSVAAQHVKPRKGCVAFCTLIGIMASLACVIIDTKVTRERGFTLVAEVPVGFAVSVDKARRCCSHFTLVACIHSAKISKRNFVTLRFLLLLCGIMVLRNLLCHLVVGCFVKATSLVLKFSNEISRRTTGYSPIGRVNVVQRLCNTIIVNKTTQWFHVQIIERIKGDQIISRSNRCIKFCTACFYQGLEHIEPWRIYRRLKSMLLIVECLIEKSGVVVKIRLGVQFKKPTPFLLASLFFFTHQGLDASF
jgi:hypothetical protein